MNNTWRETIVEAMRGLGGHCKYEDLYYRIQLIRHGPLSKQWKATVRRTIETHSSDSDNYREGNQDLFRSVGGLGSGHWGLR